MRTAILAHTSEICQLHVRCKSERRRCFRSSLLHSAIPLLPCSQATRLRGAYDQHRSSTSDTSAALSSLNLHMCIPSSYQLDTAAPRASVKWHVPWMHACREVQALARTSCHMQHDHAGRASAAHGHASAASSRCSPAQVCGITEMQRHAFCPVCWRTPH